MKYLKQHYLAVMIAAACTPTFADDFDEASQNENSFDEVVVTASPFAKNAETVSHPVNVLSGDKLQNAAASTLGETLNGQPGVSSASFGPGVGLPIIRGQSDNRVKVMQDSVGSMDASAASPDHAVTLEPLLATKIEVLRGPAALRYGSGAIGGVVNVLDNRIPDKLPEGVEGGVEIRTNSVNKETNGVAKINIAAGDFAFHVDGIKRDSDDMEIPGYAQKNPENLSDATKGHIANTDAQYKAGTLGASYIGEDGFIGLSVNKLDNNYGVPPDSDELVRIDMHQTRYDIKGELSNPFEGFEKITAHIGHADYNHTEMENGAPGTKFTNDAYEGRVELIHDAISNRAGDWNGAIGLQAASSIFAAVGEEAFIPKSDIRSAGLFIVEDVTKNNWTYELGARGDFQSITPQTGSLADQTIDHKSANLSATTTWHFTPNQQVVVGVARSQRAPSVEELLADGPHPATGAYLVGDRNLQEETSTNIELGYHWHSDGILASVNAFYNHIKDFIYSRNEENPPAGICDERGELTCYLYTQANATFKGVETEIKIPLNSAWNWRIFSDYVRATLDDGSDLPRITPLRFGNSIDYDENNWSANLSISRSAKQNYPGDNESATDGYTRVDARIGYTVKSADTSYLVFVKGTNILNEEIRNASSYLRDIAPEAGRGIQAGIRVSF